MQSNKIKKYKPSFLENGTKSTFVSYSILNQIINNPQENPFNREDLGLCNKQTHWLDEIREKIILPIDEHLQK